METTVYKVEPLNKYCYIYQVFFNLRYETLSKDKKHIHVHDIYMKE